MLLDVCDTVIVNITPVENPVRLVMVDAGITTSLSEQDLGNFKAVFTAVVIGDVSLSNLLKILTYCLKKAQV